MIVGSGLLARAFASAYAERTDVFIHAAGVSNSACKDAHEFSREFARVENSLARSTEADAFVYFSTCSLLDPEAQESDYVKHKVAMERLVASHPRYLIVRLPQLAGSTPNPHTLLNYLYARVSRSESFGVWLLARRNIIDVVDVVALARVLIAERSLRQTVCNIANPNSYSMMQIVASMESAVGKKAIYQSFYRGSEYPIDTGLIQSYLTVAGVKFEESYLDKVVRKYYGPLVGHQPLV